MPEDEKTVKAPIKEAPRGDVSDRLLALRSCVGRLAGPAGPGPGVASDICVIDKYPLGVAVVIGQ